MCHTRAERTEQLQQAAGCRPRTAAGSWRRCSRRHRLLLLPRRLRRLRQLLRVLQDLVCALTAAEGGALHAAGRAGQRRETALGWSRRPRG